MQVKFAMKVWGLAGRRLEEARMTAMGFCRFAGTISLF